MGEAEPQRHVHEEEGELITLQELLAPQDTQKPLYKKLGNRARHLAINLHDLARPIEVLLRRSEEPDDLRDIQQFFEEHPELTISIGEVLPNVNLELFFHDPHASNERRKKGHYSSDFLEGDKKIQISWTGKTKHLELTWWQAAITPPSTDIGTKIVRVIKGNAEEIDKAKTIPPGRHLSTIFLPINYRSYDINETSPAIIDSDMISILEAVEISQRTLNLPSEKRRKIPKNSFVNLPTIGVTPDTRGKTIKQINEERKAGNIYINPYEVNETLDLVQNTLENIIIHLRENSERVIWNRRDPKHILASEYAKEKRKRS